MECKLSYQRIVVIIGRHGGLIVSVLDPRSSGPGASPGRGHYVVFLGKSLYSLSASQWLNGYCELNAGGNPVMD